MNSVQVSLNETFCVNLSEIEVRMTLREMCGSKWYDYPFQGEVYENSFSIKENDYGVRRNISGVVLEGSFYEENGKTTVTISPKLKPQDLIVYLIFAIVSAGSLEQGISEMFVSLFQKGGEDFFLSFLTAVAGGVFLIIVYFMTIGSYQRSIEKLKKAFKAAQRHEEK